MFGDNRREEVLGAKSACLPDPKEVKQRLEKEKRDIEEFLAHMEAAALVGVGFDYGLGPGEHMQPRMVMFAQVGGAYLRIQELKKQIKEQEKRIKEQKSKN